ncbi:NAD dependent epimerase/dehydratase family protein [Verticillium dahliae VdLs.17]|uniref:NAD dependent epimerase/dehydratase family protein n=1 Tax=Verticillium dahliae (strain VdLs.17 / ATCC MYA-4575 / FGSC 10137) TaxID=498257 RepID=G2XBM1_VERDV|nr:NAD dependent epimerase/dehydratase family protein [Verticillium dahliae VdLs.17]EGY16389.1 NAD dependent epimerase/dehydratase family protein [Verticillium dahliae VdLs.17]
MPHVLILGGHGKIAQHLTPLLLRASHTVTSVIRADDQAPTIRGLAPADGRGTLHVLIRSLEDVTSQDRAQAILSEVKPDAVVFSAGAGGKGGADRHANETDPHHRPRRNHALPARRLGNALGQKVHPHLVPRVAPRAARVVGRRGLGRRPKRSTRRWPAYYDAKVTADEVLYEAGGARRDFAAVSLRPGTLTEGDVGGVELGRTGGAKGEVSRRTVAEVTARLVDAEGLQTSWVDLLDGQEDIDEAVKRVVKEGVDVAEGEPVYDKVRKA